MRIGSVPVGPTQRGTLSAPPPFHPAPGGLLKTVWRVVRCWFFYSKGRPCSQCVENPIVCSVCEYQEEE